MQRWLCALLISLGGSWPSYALELIQLPDQPLSVGRYAPNNHTCQGLVLISPGVGGSASDYGYLAEALAEQGYLSLVIGHLAAGRADLQQQRKYMSLRRALEQLTTQPHIHQARLQDLQHALQWAHPQCPQGLSILIGHSMGAATTLLEAGADNLLGVDGKDAFDLYIALSPQGVGPIFPSYAWQPIVKPVLLITGSRDRQLFAGGAQQRSAAYDKLSSHCKWLALIDRASHINFAGQGFSANTEKATIAVVSDFLAAQKQDCQSTAQYPNMQITRSLDNHQNVDQ